jgi:hypothetical protein
VAALAVFGVSATLASAAAAAAAAADPWAAAQKRLSYPIFEPTQTLGHKVSSFGYQPCPGGKSRSSIFATYGSYKGVLMSKTKGFGIFEGSPAICSDHAEFWPQGTRTIGGVKATLGVYCDVPKHCSLAQGVANGYILLWKRGKTRIQMDSAHITLAQFLKVASSLKPVA